MTNPFTFTVTELPDCCIHMIHTEKPQETAVPHGHDQNSVAVTQTHAVFVPVHAHLLYFEQKKIGYMPPTFSLGSRAW